MKGSHFTADQIIRILQDAEAGLSVADICRKHNCSEQSFYRWKNKFGGMEVSEGKRLRELERENAELKKMVAEQGDGPGCLSATFRFIGSRHELGMRRHRCE